MEYQVHPCAWKQAFLLPRLNPSELQTGLYLLFYPRCPFRLSLEVCLHAFISGFPLLGGFLASTSSWKSGMF